MTSDNHSEFRFGIKHLFYAMSLIAAGMGVSPLMIVPSLLIIAAWTFVFRTKQPLVAFAWLIIFLLIVCCAGAIMPVSGPVREAARRSQCQNNMRQIMLAVLNYESAHGHFPADTITLDANGKELRHSWRVQILKFLEAGSAYESYRFDEPWDSPHNSTIQLDNDVWSCPSNRPANNSNVTPYKLVVGPGTAFEVDKKTRIDETLDGTVNVVALVEDISNPVDVFRPADLSPAEAAELYSNLDKRTCAHCREKQFTTIYDGNNLATLEGAVYLWSANPKNVLDPGVFLIDDDVHYSDAVHDPNLVEQHYGRITALLIYVLLMILPGFGLYLKPRIKP